MRILLVDDNFDDLTLTEHALKNLHPKFEFANCLEDADARTISYNPHLVIMDVGIPNIFGGPQVPFSDILAYLKKFHNVAKVLLTGHVDSAHVDQAFAAGAVAYLDKDLVSDWPGFQARIKDAMTTHNAILIKSDISTILLNQSHGRSSMETMRTELKKIGLQIKFALEKMGGVQDQKEGLMKKQIREDVKREIDAKWRKWLTAIAGTIGWAVAIGFWEGFKRLIGWKKN